MGKYLSEFHNKLLLTDRTNYYREQYQSYMTGPEWRNVEMAEEYAQFMREGNSMFSFPYFRQIWDLWKVFFKSYNAARQYNSRWAIWSSEYMLMDGFVSIFTTMELLPKGIISLLLYPFIKSKNTIKDKDGNVVDSEMQQHLAAFYENYSKNLQTIPFYDHKYKEIRQQLKTAYDNCKVKSWGDWWSWKIVSMELFARQWISKPLSYWFHTEDNLVTPKTDIIVKYKVENTSEPQAAIESFKAKLGDSAELIVDNQVFAKDKNPEKNYTGVYARLRVPRYAAFFPILQKLEADGIHVKKIAGQDHVQVKCEINASTPEQLKERQEALNRAVTVAQPLYTYGDRVHAARQICLFDVPTKQLGKAIQQIEAQKDQGIKINFIHNF